MAKTRVKVNVKKIQAKLENALLAGMKDGIFSFKRAATFVMRSEFDREDEGSALNKGNADEAGIYGDSWASQSYMGQRKSVMELIAAEEPEVKVIRGRKGTTVMGYLGNLDNMTPQTTFYWRRLTKKDSLFYIWNKRNITFQSAVQKDYNDGSVRSVIPDYNTPEGYRGLVAAVEFGGAWTVKPGVDRDYLLPSVDPKRFAKEVVKTIKPVSPYLKVSKNAAVIDSFKSIVAKEIEKEFKK